MIGAFDDLSQRELAQMSDATFESHVALALAEAGIVPVDPPGERPARLVLNDKQTYYQVEGSDLLFASAADAAQAAALAVGAKKSRYMRNYSTQSYAAKLCGDETEHAGDGFHKVTVSPVSLPSYETLAAALSALGDAEQKIDDWKARSEAFDKFIHQRQEIHDRLWRIRSAAADKLAEAEHIRSTRERYLELAEGDEGIAERFLFRAFSAEQVAEAEDMLGLDRGSLATPPPAESSAGGAE